MRNEIRTYLGSGDSLETCIKMGDDSSTGRGTGRDRDRDRGRSQLRASNVGLRRNEDLMN